MSEHGSIKFWSEIGRRNVLRVAAVYVGFSWMVIHSGVVMGEALELPHWIMRLISALLIVGFPAVVAFAWVYEITPDGLKRSTDVEKDASLTHRTAQRLNVVIIALMILLAVLYGVDRFLVPHEAGEGNAHTAAEGAPKAPAGEGVSIAVLPFLNLSSDKEQEFFSDGMTEEITSALAKVKGLQVVGRTSAFKFKGQNEDLRAIGLALGAANLLEGSVRKEGNRIRVTGQLIRADNGRHIWTENYDRELTSVFAIQDEIAHAIAAALQVPLGLKPGETLVTSRTSDADAYQDYLRAKAIYRGRGTAGNNFIEAARLLEQVVARDPGYGPAWSLLADAYDFVPQEDPAHTNGDVEVLRGLAQTYLPKAEAAARRAIELNPEDAQAYVALARNAARRGEALAGVELDERAFTLDPGNPDVLHMFSSQLASHGRQKEAVPLRQRLRTIEPFVPIFSGVTGRILAEDGQYEAAAAILKALPSDFRARHGDLAATYAAMGKYKEAADEILSAPADAYDPGEAETAARLLRQAPARIDVRGLPKLKQLAFAYLYVGATAAFADGSLALFEDQTDAGYGGPLDALWYPWAAPARHTDRFKALIRKRGLLDLWRAKGWPPQCHPVGKDDFACE